MSETFPKVEVITGVPAGGAPMAEKLAVLLTMQPCMSISYGLR
jgi:hypothetical protein